MTQLSPWTSQTYISLRWFLALTPPFSVAHPWTGSNRRYRRPNRPVPPKHLENLQPSPITIHDIWYHAIVNNPQLVPQTDQSHEISLRPSYCNKLPWCRGHYLRCTSEQSLRLRLNLTQMVPPASVRCIGKSNMYPSKSARTGKGHHLPSVCKNNHEWYQKRAVYRKLILYHD